MRFSSSNGGFHLSESELARLQGRWSIVTIGGPTTGNIAVEGDLNSYSPLRLEGAVIRQSHGRVAFLAAQPLTLVATRFIELGRVVSATAISVIANGVGETSIQRAPITAPLLSVQGAANARFTDGLNHVGTLSANLSGTGWLEFSQAPGFVVSSSTGGAVTLTSDGGITATDITSSSSVVVSAISLSVDRLSAATNAALTVDELDVHDGIRGTAALTIQPRSAGRLIQFGGSSNPSSMVLSSRTTSGLSETLANVTIGGGGRMLVVEPLTLKAPTLLAATELELHARVASTRPLTFRARTQVVSSNVRLETPSLTIDGALDLKKQSLSVLGSLAFAPMSSLLVQVDAAESSGRIALTGSVNLAQAVLAVSGTFEPPNGTRIPLIENDEDDAVIGTFEGLGELASAAFFGTNVSYVDRGNDVALLKYSSPTTITLVESSVAELKPRGTEVGVLSTPGSPESREYSLVGGAGDTDNSSFAIVGSRLTTDVPFDFSDGPTRSVRIASSDTLGRSIETVFTISIIDNLPPAFTATPSVRATPEAPLVDEIVLFSAPTTDAEGDIVNVVFDYGDGTVDVLGAHAYTRPGNFTVRVAASDGYDTAFAVSTLNVARELIVLDSVDDEHPRANSGCTCASGEELSLVAFAILFRALRRVRNSSLA